MLLLYRSPGLAATEFWWYSYSILIYPKGKYALKRYHYPKGE